MKRKRSTGKTLRSAETIARRRKSRTTGATIGAVPQERAFQEVVAMIEAARERAYEAVNTGLIDLYWRVGSTSPARLSLTGGGETPSWSWRTSSGGMHLGFAASPLRISGECANFTTLTEARQNSQHC